jgi:hypothetical protein
MFPANTAREERALHVLARVVADTPFRAGELLDRVRVKTREAFGFKDVEWRHTRSCRSPARASRRPTRPISRC